ncbi:MAG: dienelactone hydrolase family protein [Alphaproteobacteria bacterium]|nr:dienelactone hydrolase family protein [Alphaproteobacteria bacterium]MBR1757048.1 dienelactone hydrolase family protein [Alphaproteobacteria bacterium]
MFEYDSYILGKTPHKLVIFLHGYNGTAATHQYAIDWLKEMLQDAVLIIPHAPEVSDKNPERRQWFGMLKYDPEDTRSQAATSVTDILAIYNNASKEIDSCAAQINLFIDAMQQKYGIDNKHTYLCGFSQGAMLTLYTALTRSADLGGAFVLSGLTAGADLLQTKITARPPLYVFHGENDLRVQYKTLPSTIDWLKKNNILPKVQTYKDLEHRINQDEIQKIANTISKGE